MQRDGMKEFQTEGKACVKIQEEHGKFKTLKKGQLIRSVREEEKRGERLEINRGQIIWDPASFINKY